MIILWVAPVVRNLVREYGMNVGVISLSNQLSKIWEFGEQLGAWTPP